jgi:C-terminal domain on Strawberry notch homologue
MNTISSPAAALAAARPDAPAAARPSDAGTALVAAARLLLLDLERGRVIDAKALRAAIVAAFGGSDAEGAWAWKIAYDACEAAQVLFLRRFAPAMRERAASPGAFLAMLAKLAALVPSHTRRSEDSIALQQFSTPVELGFVASTAAALTPSDVVLEPSAGTGLQRFGTDNVAEITGRSRRIVRRAGAGGLNRFAVEARAGSANLADARAFMDDEKRILVFSDAGGTGRSYHDDLAAKNQRLRVHYLLEAGWKPDTAIQGLGRSNRTNQAQPPLFRPIATDVKAEKRFLSTIARRLDTLGAITKGQRQTGGQGLFRADDNLESVCALTALRQLYLLLYTGKVEGCSLQAFEDSTGLRLTDDDGSLREDLPPITTFLNRLLALTIELQNKLFGVFEDLHTHWREADRADFVRAWEAELAAVPEFADSTFHIVTGLLLPIWKRLPNESMRVYRLQTDQGERVIGRLVSPGWVAQAFQAAAPVLFPADAFAAVLDGRTLLQLQDGLELRRATVMREFRIELLGFTDGMVERLKTIGLMSEIIAWKLRLFVPTGASGPAILAVLLERFPLVRVAGRAAA